MSHRLLGKERVISQSDVCYSTCAFISAWFNEYLDLEILDLQIAQQLRYADDFYLHIIYLFIIHRYRAAII